MREIRRLSDFLPCHTGVLTQVKYSPPAELPRFLSCHAPAQSLGRQNCGSMLAIRHEGGPAQDERTGQCFLVLDGE